MGGGGLPAPGGPATGRPVAAVTTMNAQAFARFSTPIRANATAAVTDAGWSRWSNRDAADTGDGAGAGGAAGDRRRHGAGEHQRPADGGGAAGQNAYVLTASGLSIIPMTAASAQNAPVLTGNGVVNTANYTSGIAPGGLISIFGRNLGTAATACATPLPTVLGGACVTLNNAPIPLLATSTGQINAQVPPTLAAGRVSSGRAVDREPGGVGIVTVTVARYAPAIFLDAQGPAITIGTAAGKQGESGQAGRAVDDLRHGVGNDDRGTGHGGNPSPSSPLAVTAPVNSVLRRSDV